jgi:hypothetical protein
MKHALLALAIASLVVPASALGKGPSAASIDGPGSSGITFSNTGEPGAHPLGDLLEQAGFFSAWFRSQPDPMLAERPKVELGPKYTITYTVPGPNKADSKIRHDVYPYASPGPVAYMEPRQPIFDTQTRGGWFRADPALKQTLVNAGLPSTPPETSSAPSTLPTMLVSLLTVALLLVTATAVALRRRARPAAA